MTVETKNTLYMVAVAAAVRERGYQFIACRSQREGKMGSSVDMQSNRPLGEAMTSCLSHRTLRKASDTLSSSDTAERAKKNAS